jgi:flagellin-like hook-associated protein FlgL
MSVTLSAGVRKALTSLQSTAAAAQQTQFRLATGKKVNSALDNPASFFTAAGLTNRANDLGRLLDSMGQAVKTLEAADKGIKAITKLIENAQSLAKQAEAAGADVAAAAATAGTLTGTADVSGYTAGGATSITIAVNGGTATTVNIANGDDEAAVVAAINTAALGVTASLSGNNIRLTNGTTGTGTSITVGGAAATALFGATPTAAAGTDAVAAVTKRADLARDFDALRTQIDQLAADSGYNGVNLLTGNSLAVQFNENGTSKLDIAGNSNTATGLNISTAASNWANNTNVKAASDQLKAAADTLRSRASTFGANLSVVQNRQDFTRNMIGTLTEGSDALTSADSNEEAANLLALQTRTQLSQTALSLSAQADQGVLRLF